MLMMPGVTQANDSATTSLAKTIFNDQIIENSYGE